MTSHPMSDEISPPTLRRDWSNFLELLPPLVKRDDYAVALAVREEQLREIEALRFNLKDIGHRAKNIASVVQTLARQTMRQSGTKEDFERRFSSRLTAYCDSLDVLIANDWRGMSLHDVVRSQLSHFGAGEETQITVDGPMVSLTPTAARSIGLALHELATNAVKYGSLSVPEGTVEVTWRLEHFGAGLHLHMEWREGGGPVVSAPTHCGFGRRVIEQVTTLSAGTILLYSFPATGVRWALDVEARDVLVPRDA